MLPHENDPAIVRMFGTARFWLVGIALITAISVFRVMQTRSLPAPDIYSTVPEFEFVNQAGTAFGSADLSGNIWIANFIFTRCTTVCPIFTNKMSELQMRTEYAATKPTLISFSVDPDFDTTEVLQSYATRFRANPARWHFLTGPTDSVRRVVEDGMKSVMGDADAVLNPEELIHGSHFVLVDPDLNIRGYYAVSNEDTIDKLLADMRAVANENRHGPKQESSGRNNQ